MSESIPNQRMDLKNEIINIINKEHSKINVRVPDTRGEINTENDSICSIDFRFRTL